MLAFVATSLIRITNSTLQPLHRAFHVGRAWPTSKYEDINDTLYRPSIVPGDGAEQVWGGSSLPKLRHKTATGGVHILLERHYQFILNANVKRSLAKQNLKA